MRKILYSFIVLFLVFSSCVKADISTGLVAHYEFENNTNDTTSNGYHLVSEIGTLGFATGKFNQAANFGTGGIRVKTTDAKITRNDSVTYSFWMKSSAEALYILGTYTHPITIFSLNNALISSSTEIGTGVAAQYSTGMSGAHLDGTWHHVTITSNGTSNVTFYLDGVSKGSVTATLTLEDTLYLGDVELGTNYSGLMDDLRIYNRELSATEVTELYNYEPTPPTPTITLKAHGGVLQFDGNSGTYISNSDVVTTNIDNITMQAWINWNGGTEDQVVIYNGDSATNGYGLLINSDGKLITMAGGQDTWMASTLSQNTWYHIALTINNGTGQMYINGVTSGNSFSIVPTTPTESFSIGASHIGGNNFNGMMDEVRIWNTARTATQIKESYNQQLNGDELGLVAYYNFDERVGDTVKDITGNGNNGTIEGNVTRLNFLGDALNFDGTATKVAVSANSNTILSDTTPFSVGGWIKTTATSGIFISQDYSSVGQFEYYSGIDNEGKIFFEMYKKNADLLYRLTSTQVINDGQWHFVTLTKDSTDVKIYIDAKEDNTGTQTQGSIGGTSNNGQLSIGYSNEAEYFNGNIAQVSMWNKSLTQDEIKKLMSSSPDTMDTNLVGYWPINKGDGNIAYDSSQNSNDGVITNSNWINTAPEIYGDTVYATVNTTATAKLAWENFNYEPTYNVDNPDNTAPVILSSNTILYTPDDTATNTLKFTAEASGETADLDIKFIGYEPTQTSTPIESVTLTLNDINLAEHNITNIFIIDSDNFEGTITEANSLSIDTINSSNLIENITYSKYSLAFEVDSNTYWYYNQSDGKLYTTVDEENSKWVLETTALEISLADANWDGYILLKTLEYELGSTDYDDATAEELEMKGLYFVASYLNESREQILYLDKIIPDKENNKIYTIKTQIDTDGKIKDIQKTETNMDVSEIKFIATITATELTSLYNAFTHNSLTLDFPETSEGYEIYTNATTKKYALNESATRYLLEQLEQSDTPTLAYPITNVWSYLSLPTNMTICTDEFKDILTDICNQTHTLDTIFANVDDNKFIVLKYTNSWSYFAPNDENTYNMNKFNSLNHKEGILVKATAVTTLHLPYDIFSLYPDNSYPIYTKGWYLGASLFDMKPSDVKKNVDANTSFTLKYILQLDDTNQWDLYAPLNDSKVDNTLERITEIDAQKSFWINVK